METASYPPIRVRDKIVTLKPGSWLRVLWHDASSFSRVRVITPEIYETWKTTSGYFYACKKAPRSNMFYLILYTEETDGVPSEGSSIPLGCIEDIQVEFEASPPLKSAKKAYKDEAPIKIVEVVRKVVV